MKFNISPNTINYEELQEKLATKFPEYTFAMRNKQFLVAKKSNTEGANIILRKKKMMIIGSFPTVSGTMLFGVCIVLLGVIIPLIIYLSVYHKKLKTMENKIGDYLQKEYEMKV